MTEKKKITKLTPKQEEELVEYREKWLKIGLSTEAGDFKRAEKAIAKLYEKIGEKFPTDVRYMSSPLAAEDEINRINGTPKKFNSTYFWGSQESYWIAFYLFCQHIGVEYKGEDSELLGYWAEIAQSCSWWYPFKEACFICDRPQEIHMLEDNRTLHNEDGMAVRFRDGFGFYALNGVRVPDWIVTTPSNELDARRILALDNVEQRTQGIKKAGIHNFLEHFNAKKIHRWNDYELFLLTIEGNEVGPYLKMVNPSTGEIHVEGVGDAEKYEFKDPTIDTCQKALAWRVNQTGEYVEPKLLT